MEIIAERKKGAGSIFVACIAVGVFCFAFVILIGVMYAIGETELDALIAGGIMFFIVGVAFLAVGIILLRRLQRLPKRIVLEGNLLDFGNGLICTADKIENVTCHKYKYKRNTMHRFSYGSLTVYVMGEKIDYEFIANVEYAYGRLTELMNKAKK